MKALVKDIALWVFWYPFRYVVRFLPLTVAYKFGDLAGALFMRIAPKRTHMVKQGLEEFLGDHLDGYNIDVVVKRSYELWGKTNIESLLFPHLTQELTMKVIPEASTEHLEDALRRGQGAILMLAHLGSVRLVIPGLAHRGYALVQIGAPANIWKEKLQLSPVKRKILDLEHEFEKKLPATIVFGAAAAKVALRSLRDNGIVIVASDGRGGQRWVEATVFGRTVKFSAMPSIIAQKAHSTLLPMFIIRRPDERHRIMIEEPIASADLGYTEEEAMGKYAQIFERYVAKYPCHYAEFLRLCELRSDLDETPFYEKKVSGH